MLNSMGLFVFNSTDIDLMSDVEAQCLRLTHRKALCETHSMCLYDTVFIQIYGLRSNPELKTLNPQLFILPHELLRFLYHIVASAEERHTLVQLRRLYLHDTSETVRSFSACLFRKVGHRVAFVQQP